jgi:uncharacterized protein YegP (UPF0339 family)
MLTRRLFLAACAAVAVAGLARAADKPMTFEIYADKASEFRWRLKDGDDKILATSGQGYSKKADCKDMVDKFVKDISAYNLEVYESESKKGDFRWHIKAKNGQIVGASSGAFKTKADAEKATEEVKKGAKDAKVDDKTKEKK